jgi:hypothetical protein
MDYTKFSKLYWQILSQFSRIHIHVDGLKALFVCVKRLGMAFKFGFKFPVGGSAPDIQPIQKWLSFANLKAISTHEKFPRTENFPKISLLKVEIFQVENLLKICVSQSNFTKFSFRGKFS